jgi:hypothetical protein
VPAYVHKHPKRGEHEPNPRQQHVFNILFGQKLFLAFQPLCLLTSRRLSTLRRRYDLSEPYIYLSGQHQYHPVPARTETGCGPHWPAAGPAAVGRAPPRQRPQRRGRQRGSARPRRTGCGWHPRGHRGPPSRPGTSPDAQAAEIDLAPLAAGLARTAAAGRVRHEYHPPSQTTQP